MAKKTKVNLEFLLVKAEVKGVPEKGTNLAQVHFIACCMQGAAAHRQEYVLRCVEPRKNEIATGGYRFASVEQIAGWDSILGCGSDLI